MRFPLFELGNRFVQTMSRKLTCGPAERNKQFILEVLEEHFEKDRPGNVLEISSGVGAHAAHFAEKFPKLSFQTSENDLSLFDSIRAYALGCSTKNVKLPVHVDVTKPCRTWDLQDAQYDYIININMMHITPFECTEALFQNSSLLLLENGLLITYGPYAHDGVIAPDSNVRFDKSLRSQNPQWGLRDIRELKNVARNVGIELIKIYNLPANNNCLVWKKIK